MSGTDTCLCQSICHVRTLWQLTGTDTLSSQQLMLAANAPMQCMASLARRRCITRQSLHGGSRLHSISPFWQKKRAHLCSEASCNMVESFRIFDWRLTVFIKYSFNLTTISTWIQHHGEERICRLGKCFVVAVHLLHQTHPINTTGCLFFVVAICICPFPWQRAHLVDKDIIHVHLSVCSYQEHLV